MTDLNKLRSEFEAIETVSEILKDYEISFSVAHNRYYHTVYTTFIPDEVHFLNGAWYAWQEKAKAQAVPAQKFFSHDFNGDGFKYEDSLEEAQKEAEVNIDWYRERVADGHHVADDGEFFELCYGVVIASAGYTVDAVVTEDHHKNDEFTKYEVGTEILKLHFNKCNSETGVANE